MLPKRSAAFLLKAGNAWTAPVSAKRLASAGRLDVVARALIALLGTPVAAHALFIAVLAGPPNPPLGLVVDCGRAKPLGSEAEFAEAFSSAVRGEPPEGYETLKLSFEEAVSGLKAAGYNIYYLHEAGADIRETNIVPPAAFVLGDHIGLTREDEALLEAEGIGRVSLGPLPYFTSHCVVLVCEEILRRAHLAPA